MQAKGFVKLIQMSFMRECETRPNERLRSFFQRRDWRWMLFLISLGLLLCWDAAFSSQGYCYGNGCSHDIFARRIYRRIISKNNDIGLSASTSVLPMQNLVSLWPLSLEMRVSNLSIEPVVHAAVLLDHSVLLALNLLVAKMSAYRQMNGTTQVACIYSGIIQTSVLAVEDGFIQCEHPPSQLQETLKGSTVTFKLGTELQSSTAIYGDISWKKVVYNWVPLEEEGDALLFVKGLSKSKRSRLPQGLECLYGDRIRTAVTGFCQENVRCKLPPAAMHLYLVGKVVTVALGKQIFPSVVKFNLPMPVHSIDSSPGVQKPHFLCGCTLVWNGAKFLREWVIYHSHLGMEKFFLFDNNSDDGLSEVVSSLQPYNVSRHSWPWLKTQEASFSMCAIQAASKCTWVAFIDLDEFIFPKRYMQAKDEPPLMAMMKEYDATHKGKLGQLKVLNLNFGPSGMKTLPSSGQMLNYKCRLRNPKRVKSIVRIAAMHGTYCSRVHYFELKDSFVSEQSLRKDAVIHHYKYQVWEDFKSKFVRRAATFVTDWGKLKDMASFDRTPGLGVEAVEPSDWAYQFCEVEDTALRDYVLNTSQLFTGGKLLWV